MGALVLAALTALEWCLAVYLTVSGYGCRLEIYYLPHSIRVWSVKRLALSYLTFLYICLSSDSPARL